MSLPRLTILNSIAYVILIVACFTGVSWQLSQETLDQLHNIELSMDLHVDPCENFYGYACGNWAQRHAHANYSEILTLQAYNFQKHMVEKIFVNYPRRHELKRRGQNFIAKALTYYYSCVVGDNADLFSYMDEIELGRGLQWPLMEEVKAYRRQDRNFVLRPWSTGQFEAAALLGQMASYGMPNPLLEAYMKNQDNGTVSVYLGRPTEMHFDAFTTMRVLSMTELPGAAQDKYFADILAIDDYWREEYERLEKGPGLVSYLSLKKSSPGLAKLVESFTSHLGRNVDTVFIQDLRYVEALAEKQWSSDEGQMLSNYLLINFLGYQLQNEQGYGEKCFNALWSKMPLAVHYLYYKHSYLPEAEHNNNGLTRLGKIINKYHLEIIDENHFHLNTEQRQKIKEKLLQKITNFGNLPEHVTQSVVEEFYSDIPDLQIGNYHKNDLQLLKHRTLEPLLCPDNMGCDSRFLISPVAVGSLVLFPFASLQPPTFHRNLDPIFTLSLLGFLMAHESTHLIDQDSLSSRMDTHAFEGILLQPNVKAAIDCMQEQHPTESLNERVCDLVATRVILKAYAGEYKNAQINFNGITSNQLFFLNQAQSFCSKNQAIDPDHDVDAVRLHQILMNVNEFAEAFHCPVGSKMNPVKKCRFY